MNRRRTKTITVETHVSTYVDADVDIDFDLIEDYITECNDEEVRDIINLAQKQLKGDPVAGALIYPKPTIMDELALRDLQEIISNRGPVWMLDILKQH